LWWWPCVVGGEAAGIEWSIAVIQLGWTAGASREVGSTGGGCVVVVDGL
jgi:hypothetical protein